MKKYIIALTISSLLSGCATMKTPKNEEGSYYQWQQPADDKKEFIQCHVAQTPNEIEGLQFVKPEMLSSSADTLNAGDIIKINVAGDKDQLSGAYIIADNGEIILSSNVISLSGKTAIEAETIVSDTLYSQGLIRRKDSGVALTITELNGINIAVKGAVFAQGQVRLGDKTPEARNVNFSNVEFGDANPGRTLSTALRAAGGVRPDAHVQTIFLIRGQQWTQFDMRGAITGQAIREIPMRSGDRIIVPSVGCLQEALVRPSTITQPGIRVYLSNLSRPANNNASAAINVDTTKLPYGTRLSQAMTTANCVGGSSMSAGRKVVLFSRNPITGQSIVVARAVEKLIRRSNRDNEDPYLMPGDSIACYDSLAMDLRDVVSVVSETITPLILFNNLD